MSQPLASSWFVCTIGKESAHNWDICKSISSWGIPSSGRKLSMNQAVKGDQLLFYLASKGFFASAKVIGPMKKPSSKEEAPWAGGIYRYGIVIPFKLQLELDEPLRIPFISMKVEGTSISVTSLRRGFAPISNSDGEFVLRALEAAKKAKISK